MYINLNFPIRNVVFIISCTYVDYKVKITIKQKVSMTFLEEIQGPVTYAGKKVVRHFFKFFIRSRVYQDLKKITMLILILQAW